MADTYTLRTARVVNKKRLGLAFNASAARAGLLALSLASLSISASGGQVGFTTSPTDLLTAVGSTSPLTYGQLPPAYTSLDGDVNDHAMVWLTLDRNIAHDETITITGAQGLISDNTNTSAAFINERVQVRTFTNAAGEYTKDVLRRTGCGERQKTEPGTLAPIVRVRAQDVDAVGDGNSIGSSFMASVGGSVTVTGNITYHDDIVAAHGLNGSAGAKGLHIPAGAKLTTTVSMPSSTNDFTVIAVYASENNNGRMICNGAEAEFTWGGGSGVNRHVRPCKAGLNNRHGGDYENTASDPWKRLNVGGCWYEHSTTTAARIGAGGIQAWDENLTTGQDHSVAIELEASNTGDVYVCEWLVYDSKLLARSIYEAGAWLDDEYQTQNRHWHVDVENGDDANSGLDEENPRLTPPDYNGSSRDHFHFGAGDMIFYKYGGELEGEYLSTRCGDAESSFSYSSQYPGTFGCYGDRSDGRFLMAYRSAGQGNTIDNHAQNPYFLVFGFDVYFERRDPRNANYAGFATVSTEASGGILVDMNNNAGDWYLEDDDPVLHAVHDCAVQYNRGKGVYDSPGSYTNERWLCISDNLFNGQWYGTTSTTSEERPSGAYISNSSVLCITENVTHSSGWSRDVASIGDWSAGSKVFTGESTASYVEANDETIIAGTSLFANFEFGAAVGPLTLTLKRTSDATEHLVAIKSKVNDNQIIVEGNPFSLANGNSVFDCLCHGGDPAANNGLCHGFYLSDGSIRAGTLNANNIHLDASDHGFQQRGGGYALNNIILDASIGGFVAGADSSGNHMALSRGNYVEGGRRTRGASFSGPRAWGLSVVSSDSPYYGELSSNIINLGYQDEYAALAPTVAGTSRAIALGKNSASTQVHCHNNTVVGFSGTLIEKIGTVALDANDRIEYNIFGQRDVGVDAITNSLFTSQNVEGAEFEYNQWFHPGGADEQRFNEAAEDFAAFVASSGESGAFKQAVFANGDADLAEYFSTLDGGTDDKAAFKAAVVSANKAGDMSGLTADEMLTWLRTQYQPQNLTAETDGNNVIIPGASMQPEPNAPQPVVSQVNGRLLSRPFPRASKL